MGIDDITYEDHKGKVPMKYADRAMFQAEPHEQTDQGVLPKVSLQWMTHDPLGAMAMAVGMYSGKVFRDIAEVTDDDRREALKAMQETHLTAGLEVIRMQFLFEGVDRAFTHQDVRQRTAVFFQESLRFAVIDDLGAASSLPPSLFETSRTRNVEIAPEVAMADMLANEEFSFEPQDVRNRAVWDYVMRIIQEGYEYLVNNQMPAEEARGLLPTAVATRIVHNTDLRNLIGHAGNRLCTQAQFHWRMVFSGIVTAIATYEPDFSWVGDNKSGFGTSQRTALIQEWRDRYAWQFQALANSEFFRPACYQLGRCPFKATFDRACSIRDRVDSFSAAGVPSSQWGIDHENTPVTIKAISPLEWLVDPAAARVPG